MKCINCKFFRMGYFEHNADGSETIFIDSDKEDLGICLHEKIGSDYKDGWLRTKTKIPPNDGIYATCDEERAELSVGKNFGCIHYELK